MKGYLICFEGIDGAGKMTQTGMLKHQFEKEGKPVIDMSYPDYASDYGKIIDRYLHGHLHMGVTEFFLLQTADKVKDIQRVNAVIKGGNIVITDRYYYSAIAYQSAGGFDYENAKTISDMMNFPKPDIVFFLDIPPRLTYERKVKQKGGSIDKHEKDIKFQEHVRTMYEKMIKENYSGCNWQKLDGTKPIDKVHADVLAMCKKL